MLALSQNREMPVRLRSQLNPLTSWRYIFGILGLHLRSRRRLVAELTSALSCAEHRFHPAFSGRCALRELGTAFRHRYGSQTAFVPDYICNVVHIALNEAGLAIETYQTDERLEVPHASLLELLTRHSDSLLLTASICGSSACIDLLSDEDTRAVIVRNNWTVLVDVCQDIGLTKRLPIGLGDRLGAVVSFNDKSFPGMLGGGYLCAFPRREPGDRLVLRKALTLYWMFVRKCLRAWLLRNARRVSSDLWLNRRKSHYEWSLPSSRFPYGTDPLQMTKLQAALGLIGLSVYPRLQGYRSDTVAQYPPLVQMTNYRTSPYVILRNGNVHSTWQYCAKAPYGSPESKLISSRPAMATLHHKGFFDDQL